MANCRNLITDVPGLGVGQAHDSTVMSGVTVLLCDDPGVAAVDVRGGGPGTRETDALGLAGSVEHVHAIVLSGGSAFGLAAASGVQAILADRGVGFEVGDARVPIVPQAVIFDLGNGGNKAWAGTAPYEALAREACAIAGTDFALGSAGAGYGASTATWRGGTGSASDTLADGSVVGALAIVNAAGSVTAGAGRHFWAGPLERGDEFGGRGWPARFTADMLALALKGALRASTTIAVVATDVVLTRPQAYRLAVMAQAGLARAIFPVHTPLDGDVVFALSTGRRALRDPVAHLTQLGVAAAGTLARAVARGVYEAGTCPAGWVGPPAYRDTFGDGS